RRRCISDCRDYIAALLRRHGLADDMQAMWDQSILEFDDGTGQAIDLDCIAGPPNGVRCGKVHSDGLSLNDTDEIFASGAVSIGQLPPFIEARFEIEQAAIEPRVAERWRQVADQRRCCTTFGECAFR